MFIHGGGATSSVLTQLAAALSQRFAVYLPDRRGRGLSGPASDRDGLPQDVDTLHAVLRRPGPGTVLGVSAGAVIARAAYNGGKPRLVADELRTFFA